MALTTHQSLRLPPISVHRPHGPCQAEGCAWPRNRARPVHANFSKAEEDKHGQAIK